MKRFHATVVLLSLMAAPRTVAESSRPVLLASHRQGWIEILDRDSLKTITRLRVGPLAESVAATGDGQTLLVAQRMVAVPDSCCAEYAIDLAHRRMRFVIEPAMEMTLMPGTNLMFAQRGNIGIDVLDTRTLERAFRLPSRAPYVLYPSADGRWLFGVTNRGDQLTSNTVEGPAVHVFDLTTHERVRQIAVPYQSLSGVWLGQAFYLFARDRQAGYLWRLTSEATSLGDRMTVALPDDVTARRDGHEALLTLQSGGTHLFLHEAFGSKLDEESQRPRYGGVFELDPSSARVASRLAPERRFGRLTVTSDGNTLYGIDLPSPDWVNPPPRLVKIDRRSGVVAERVLDPDVWNLALASIPTALLKGATQTIAIY